MKTKECKVTYVDDLKSDFKVEYFEIVSNELGKVGKQMNRGTKRIVYNILDNDEYAREDDNYLIFKTLNEMTGIDKGTAIWNVLNEMKYKGISFESITRHRRKWVELHPDIKIKATEKRQEEEEEYFMEYSNNIPRLD